MSGLAIHGRSALGAAAGLSSRGPYGFNRSLMRADASSSHNDHVDRVSWIRLQPK
ncbi:hypothetical protein RSSM_05141 [Rhodopirellula sallentina SM41]|uniref:Uncharacterized protein n=1 Tax=Rhodopirellula sallentina SM41 TaxID=1263870 RepID=M5U6D7_9BACT|nr:hypothetical protein RSSM_05141 [Rhodopirellula sallentina SM41]